MQGSLYYDLGGHRERMETFAIDYSDLSRNAFSKMINEEIAQLQAEKAKAARRFDIRINDLSLARTWRGQYSNAADVLEARERAEQKRLAKEEAQAERDARAAAKKADVTEERADKRAILIRTGGQDNYNKVFRAKTATDGERVTAACAMMLESMVHAGLVSVGYRKRALDQGFDLNRINGDVAAGRCLR